LGSYNRISELLQEFRIVRTIETCRYGSLHNQAWSAGRLGVEIGSRTEYVRLVEGDGVKPFASKPKAPESLLRNRVLTEGRPDGAKALLGDGGGLD
jgi:hypothetical protein